MERLVSEQQIRTIYRDTIDRLYGYVSRHCNGDRALAEDVTQETWLRAVREWRRKGVPDRPIAWLTTVARNLLLNELRRQRPLPLDAMAIAALEAAHGDAATDSPDPAAIVERALARLPDAQRRLLVAFHLEGRSVRQIAAACAISERATEGRLRRARKKLRKELEAAIQAAGGDA